MQSSAHEPQVNDAVFALNAVPTRLPVESSDVVTAVAATGGLLWVGTESGRLLRHDPSTSTTDEVRGRLGVGRLDNAVWRIIADPLSRSALVILQNADGYHAHGTGLVRPRWLAKLRGLRVVSATWVRVPSSNGPQPVALVGTALGAVFSLAVDSRHERDDVLAKLWNAPTSTPIDGLRVEHVAGKFVATVATSSALYIFSDALALSDLFADDRLTIVSKPDHIAPVPTPSDDADTPPADLQFMTGAAAAASRRFVWAAAAGVTHAQLEVRRRRAAPAGAPADARSAVVASVVHRELITWPVLRETAGAPMPLACNLSAFHVLLLYPTSVYAFNQISGRLTQRVTLWSASGPSSTTSTPMARSDWQRGGTMATGTTTAQALGSGTRAWGPGSLIGSAMDSQGGRDINDGKRFLSSPAAGFARDVLDDVLWVYTADGELGRLTVSDEEQTEAWKAAKAMGRFDLAMALAPLVSSGLPDESSIIRSREAVLEAQADHAAAKGDWDVAAQLYSKTDRPIETVLLSIVEACLLPGTDGPKPVGETGSALLQIGIGPRLMTIRHMITYLVRKLDHTDASKPMQRTMLATILVQLYSARLSSEPDEKEREAVRTDFGHFLADHHGDLDTGTALGVLLRNGCFEEAWDLAVLSGDVLSACELSSRRGDVDESLALLKKTTVVKDSDLLSRLVGALSNTVVPQAPKRTTAAVARALRNDGQFDDHMTVVHGLARVAREVGDAERSAEAYQAALTYLFDLLYGWKEKEGEGEAGSLSREWQKLVTSLFVLHAEFGTESEAQRSYDHVVAPYVTKRPMRQALVNALGAILRSCATAGFHRLSVFLYQALGLHDRAIHLAIGLDLELAEARVAQLGESVSDSERRTLWAAVARASGDAVGVVERSRGVLHIEDVLHDMGEFESATERVKAAVASSLEEHKRLANQAKSEAGTALEVTAALREDLDRASAWQIGNGSSRQQGSRAFSCGHRTKTKSSGLGGPRECALCGEKAIMSIDAGFERGHTLPVVRMDASLRTTLVQDLRHLEAQA